jgi:hypothetical protein
MCREIDHPSYYKEGRKIEAIDVIEDWNLDFHLGCIVKYISRAGRKDKERKDKDLMKAKWYLERSIDRAKKEE